mmetsp:Transcript_35875/g.50254  ORF Transcript_35875/g.50254 Transcript_35875/m.50254 type:complete len:115 (+) Transcript_35875:841-1185(+)
MSSVIKPVSSGMYLFDSWIENSRMRQRKLAANTSLPPLIGQVVRKWAMRWIMGTVTLCLKSEVGKSVAASCIMKSCSDVGNPAAADDDDSDSIIPEKFSRKMVADNLGSWALSS